MIVAGADENGLGPGLGPLVVTAVAVEAPGDDLAAVALGRLGLPALLADSKVVFKRTPASYGGGESAALGLAAEAGIAAPGLAAMVDQLTRGGAYGSPPGLALHLHDLPLPLWNGCGEAVRAALRAARVRVLDVVCRVVLPCEFNRRRVGDGGKATLDYQLIEEAWSMLRVRPGALVSDKVGGRKSYVPLMERSGRFWGLDVLEEEPATSRYWGLFQGDPVEVHFVRGGDAAYLPIAAASLVGKWVREAMMLCLNRALGFDAPIPHASGYWSDPKTHEAIARFDERLASRYARHALVRVG